MSFTETERREIKNYILRKIDEDDADLVAKTTDAFGISATSVKRYLDAEVEDGHITKSEQADCRYGLVFKRIDYHYDIRSITEREDYVLYEDILPVLDVNDNAKRIWRYVLPEIFNNALEHSEGKKVEAYLLPIYQDLFDRRRDRYFQESYRIPETIRVCVSDVGECRNRVI